MSSPTTRANERRQLNTMRRRAQRQLMTEEQRQANLAQRRSNYQIRMNRIASSTYSDESNLNMLHVIAHLDGERNNSEQRAQHRISERHRRHSMAYDAWTTYLARRREAYRRRTEISTTSFNSDTSVLITNNLDMSTTPRAIMETSSNQGDLLMSSRSCPYQLRLWEQSRERFMLKGAKSPILTLAEKCKVVLTPSKLMPKEARRRFTLRKWNTL